MNKVQKCVVICSANMMLRDREHSLVNKDVDPTTIFEETRVVQEHDQYLFRHFKSIVFAKSSAIRNTIYSIAIDVNKDAYSILVALL